MAHDGASSCRFALRGYTGGIAQCGKGIVYRDDSACLPPPHCPRIVAAMPLFSREHALVGSIAGGQAHSPVVAIGSFVCCFFAFC